ncbi:LacI family transcriptional regulator [Devosia pacifica]|uniref:LacI family transcriptional regulator n=2 Tax=Devosia pacifica TaxID=1335967 RepID=A0A918SG62_9HYPH|nr:LacI family transcriptional regulator [Devosia pacifica]
MTSKVRSIDVANLAKVSRTTVSQVLNGVADARIGEETRQKVLAAARMLNYTPNEVGRSLVRGSTKTVALVLRDISLIEVDLFLQPLLSGIMKSARQAGYGLRVEGARGSLGGDPYGDLVASGMIDGMIVENPDAGDQSLARLVNTGWPVVQLGSQGLPFENTVQTDNQLAGRVATEHLLQLGRRRVAHVSYSTSEIRAVVERKAGYFDALKNAKIPPEMELVKNGDFESSSGYAAMVELMSAPGGPPDAVFAGSDAIGYGVIAAALDAGLRVPKDVAVIGVDDLRTSAYFRPSLSTVRIHPSLAGSAAMGLLIELMRGREPQSRCIYIASELIARGSTLEGFDNTPRVLSSANS